MLFHKLNKLKRGIIMTSIILMFIGGVLLIIPENSIPLLSSALGFMFCVVSVFSILNFIGSSKVLMHYIYLCLGLFAGLFGIIIWVFDDFFVQMLSWLVGTVPILSGAYGIYHALVFARKSGRKFWWILLILSGSLMIFGGFIFCNPWVESTGVMIESTGVMMQVIGSTMLYSAFVSALRLIWIWPIRQEE